MAFLRQLQLLLWKNGLGVIRQPAWSLTLIVWPLIIFIIIAVTRQQFPPLIQQTCYTGARNLPSTGFFPFLETLMCTTDSNCYNTSRLVDPTAQSSRNTRSKHLPKSSPLAALLQRENPFTFSFPKDSRMDPTALVKVLDSVLGSSFKRRPHDVSFMNATNTTGLQDQETLNEMSSPVTLLKRALCKMIHPMINTTSPGALTYTVVTFCKTNTTLFEVSLDTLNQVLTELILQKPDELVTAAGMTVMLFNHLQNDTSLWESLLDLPHLFSAGSVDQALDSTKALLTNIQGAMHFIESNFPEAAASLSTGHQLLTGGVNLIHYAQKWPGRDVSISLGDVVTLQNDSLGEMVKRVLQEVQIPLDKAIGLTMNKDMVRSYICDNSTGSVVITTACITGTVDMLLHWINPDLVAKQALLAWSKRVASRDLSFARGIMHSLLGSSGEQGGSNVTRTRRSVDTQPQNIEEELFLEVGHVVMQIIKTVPQVDVVVQSILRTGFLSMKSTTLALDTVEDMMSKVLKDADQFQMTFHMLLLNQSVASAWIGHVLNSVMEATMKGLSSQSPTCEDLLDPFEWLLSTRSIKLDVWRSMICTNTSALQEALLVDWLDLVQMAEEVYYSLTGTSDFNVTLPMILSEWHKLRNNSLQFGVFLDKLTEGLNGYWMNWMPDNNTHDVVRTLQHSVVLFMVNIGEKIEKSHLWPEVKNYFHMVYWILNYRPGVTTQPPNCFFNQSSFGILCDTGLNWLQFVQAVTQALMSPSQELLVNYLKGTVDLLQHVFGNLYKHLAGSYLEKEIEGGDALSVYLINLMNNLDSFVKVISSLPNQNTSDPTFMLPHIQNLFNATGLTPLLPLLFSDSPPSVSTILNAASKLGRLNQHIFTFNESDPAMPELERLIMQFLSLEGNLTVALSHMMGHSLLTYSANFHPDDVARLKEAIQPFTNQTSAGLAEAILSAMELLKALMDSPNGDPAQLILGCIHQLQKFMISLFRLQLNEHIILPSGQFSAVQVTDLHLFTKDLLNLLTPESLQNLTQAGPDAAQDIVFQKFVAFLPPKIQNNATRFLQDFKVLQHQIMKCAAGENCLAGISEIFTFLDHILDMMLSVNGNVTVKIAPISGGHENDEITSMFFSLLLPPNHMETSKQTLHFIRLVMSLPNITVSDVQDALRQSNLTVQELNNIAALAGAANINDLMVNMMELVKAHQCFGPENDVMVTTECVKGLINGVSGFLTHLPALREDTAILSLIPLIVNKTISDVMQVNFSSTPNVVLAHTLTSILASIKMSFQVNHLNTPEIMNEIRVVEDLIKLVANMEPFKNFNNTMVPMYAQKVYLELVEWYLKRLENITSNSSISEHLHPFVNIIQMHVGLQIAQTDLSLFVSRKIEYLIKNLQYPIDGAGVSQIGQTAIEILQRLLDLIKGNLLAQNNLPGVAPLFNTTLLSSAEIKIKLYLNLIDRWMKQPNVTMLLASMFQWGNSSMTVSTPVTDFHHLLQTVVHFLSDDQQAYLNIISNVTQSLSKAIMLAEQPGVLQSEKFLAAILEAVHRVMQIPNPATAPVPLPVQEEILAIVPDLLHLIIYPDMSFASSRNISLSILKRAETIIKGTVPEMAAIYLLFGVKVGTTYFETIPDSVGPDSWNQLILNEMKTVQSLLPPNSTAQAYISVLINITHFILESGQGNMSLWASFGNPSVENLPKMIGQMGKLLSMFLQLVMGGAESPVTVPSLEGFTDLVPVLEQVMTGKANQDTWDKLEQMLETLLSVLEGTELWDSFSSVIPLFEKIMESVVKNMHAENVMTLSLKIPMETLIREIAQSVNISHLNLSEISEGMQRAIEHTVQAVQQANGTLECSEALKAWEPVREAAGLSQHTLAMWCNISLHPLLEAYTASQAVYAQLNMSHMVVEPINANTTAARIVKTILSFYQVNVNRTLVTQQLIMTFSSYLSMLASQPLSPEAQLDWYKQLQDMQLQNSLSSIKMVSDELLDVAPSLKPYIEALVKALTHVLNNYHHVQNSSSSEDLFKKAALIFLTSANITSHDMFSMMWGKSSGLNPSSLTDTINEAIELMIAMKIFGDETMIYEALEQFLASNDTSVIVEKVAEMSAWLASTQASGFDLLSQALPKIYNILMHLLSVLTRMGIDMPENMELFEDLGGNIIAMLRRLVDIRDLPRPMDQHVGLFQSEMAGGYHGKRVRQRRDTLLMIRDPIDDIIDLFYVDYPNIFKALCVYPTTAEIMETAHMFFANPDLNVVMKGATGGMPPWGFSPSPEDTIDSTLGMLSYLTLSGTFERPSMDPLMNAAAMLPDGVPFFSVIKNITRLLASEPQENLALVQETIHEVLQINLTDPQFTEQLDRLASQVCALENMESVRVLMWFLSIEPGQLCHTFLPSLQILYESLLMNTTSLVDIIFQTVIGDVKNYNVQTNWTSALSRGLGFNISSLRSLNINVTSPEKVTVGETLRNQTAFMLDVQQHMDFNSTALLLLMETTLPDKNLAILSWLLNLQRCNSTASMDMEQTDEVILKAFCSMSGKQWYMFSVLMLRHLDLMKLTYRMVLSEEMQSLVEAMIQMLEVLTDMIDKILPSLGQMQRYMHPFQDANLVANNEFHKMTRGQRSSISSHATFVTLSRALCSHGILALFGISKLPAISESKPLFPDKQKREEMIEQFKIPQNATPFCTNMYLDMVNTTGGAIAWAFLKPMLMGQILYTPDTPMTRNIMEKANATLKEFANLRKHSKEWIESSNYIVNSAKILSQTLPMLQNSLGNSFVKNFIEMQTDINVGRMKETLSNFSNMTLMLEKNKDILNQITTLSTLMVNLSSCITFDRYRGYDSSDQLNTVAQELAKNRDLYASE